MRRMAYADLAAALRVAARVAGPYLDELVEREMTTRGMTGIHTPLQAEIAKACREIVRDALVEYRRFGPREEAAADVVGG